MNRRNLLRGAAGFTLALPLLPSLQQRNAKAAPGDSPAFFVAMGTGHGGVWGENLYPVDSTLNHSDTYGHEIRRGALLPEISGSRASLSPVLSAGSDKLSAALARKMNVIRGVDVGFYLAHHTGGHLGNFAANVGDAADQLAIRDQGRATIDQIMAWSESFYPSGSPILERSMTMGLPNFSYNWASPGDPQSALQPIATLTSSQALFNRIFVPPSDPGETRPLIVDRVLEDYRRLRNGNRRLSSGDRQRLDDHMGRIDELERKLNVTISCDNVAVPTRDSDVLESETTDFPVNPTAQTEYWQLFNDVIVAAFACGSSRIATMHIGEIFSDYAGDWHQEIAHKAAEIDGVEQGILADAHQRFFEGVFVDLATKLDGVEALEGQTLLDCSYVQWTHESGAFTHSNISTPVISAGSAGGQFQTGNYLDYRNLDLVAGNEYDAATEVNHAGLLYTQYLATVMNAMGIPRAEWEEPGGGYGLEFYTDYFGTQAHHQSVSGDLSSDLPFLRGTV